MRKRRAEDVQSTPRPIVDARLKYACELCSKRKIKCDRGTPCSRCAADKVECRPSRNESAIERPRKKRFAEAELLRVIRRYELALAEYGADIAAIRGKDSEDQSEADATQAGPCEELDSDEYHGVLSILDGAEDRGGTLRHPYERGKDFYDRIFKEDDSAFLFALEPAEGVAPHPVPFDMVKLWQVYCENVHPVNKFLHVPSFQRLMYSHGSCWSVAPAADQALCFAVYLAAVVSLTTEECEAMFLTPRSTLLQAYKIATQVWLRRAQLWRSSELSVLQALIIFLSSMQNFADSRSVVCFTAAADRIARRLGLHCNAGAPAKGCSIVEHETRVRLWWEIVLLDSKAVERAGLGTSVMAGNWDVRLPLGYSDRELDCLIGHEAKAAPQLSLDMLPFLIRSESARFLASLRHSKTIPAGWNEFFAGNNVAQSMSVRLRHLRLVDDFEGHLHATYLCSLDNANILHELTKSLARLLIGRMRMSVCIAAESQARHANARKAVQLDLLKYCVENMDAFNEMRADPTLTQFRWFMMQNLPIVAYILMLRLLAVHTSGQVVEAAWRALEEYKRLGTRLLMDTLTLKAWDARCAADTSSPLPLGEEPSFILEARTRVRGREDQPHLSESYSDAEQSDFMTLLFDMISSEANGGF